MRKVSESCVPFGKKKITTSKPAARISQSKGAHGKVGKWEACSFNLVHLKRALYTTFLRQGDCFLCKKWCPEKESVAFFLKPVIRKAFWNICLFRSCTEPYNYGIWLFPKIPLPPRALHGLWHTDECCPSVGIPGPRADSSPANGHTLGWHVSSSNLSSRTPPPGILWKMQLPTQESWGRAWGSAF